MDIRILYDGKKDLVIAFMVIGILFIAVIVTIASVISSEDKDRPDEAHGSNTPTYYSSPASPYTSTEPEAEDKTEDIEADITLFLKTWMSAWESQSLPRFMGLYSMSFYGRNMSFSELETYQGGIFGEFSTIELSISNITYTAYSDERITVTFVQVLTMDDYSDKGKVTMVLEKEYGDWKIVSETWQPYH